MRFSVRRLASCSGSARELIRERINSLPCGTHGIEARVVAWTGALCAVVGMVGAGSVATSCSAVQKSCLVLGSGGGRALALPCARIRVPSVRLPKVARRQARGCSAPGRP